MPSFAVILAAAGSASRFGRNKLVELLAGKPILLHSLRAFTRRDDVSHIVVATQCFSEIHQAIAAAASSIFVDPRLNFCPGGPCRAESVRLALQELPEDVEWVAVHDAARPLVSQELISDTFAAAQENGAAVPALPVNLTIKQAPGPLPAKVVRTVPRQELWAMQTPQIVRRRDLLEGYEKCTLPPEQVTDDVQLLEMIGKEVWLVPGDDRNLKITTPLDLQVAELLLRGER
jgi:2-C-methyl-D-erythritol 4-phosphate cytidylyltransferase